MNVPAELDQPEIVSTESLEHELTAVRGAAIDPPSGVFGRRSITWQVDREAAIFLGAGRALLLQLSYPWVAAAVEQHSDRASPRPVLRRPISSPVGPTCRRVSPTSGRRSRRSLAA